MWLRDQYDLWGFSASGIYEPHETNIVKNIVKPGFCCLDIGANIGYYTVLMAELGAYVSAFEPDCANYQILEMNTQKYDRVDINNFAVSNYKDNVPFYRARVGQYNINHGMGRMYCSKWCYSEPVKVNTITIDSLQKHNVDFVKIDVEGWEWRVLKGMEKTIDKFKPTMIIEFHVPTLLETNTSPLEMYLWLISKGYKITLIPNQQDITFDNLIRECSNEGGGRNILCTIV